MKQSIFFLFLLLLTCGTVSGQDIISKRDGSEIKSKVIEVGESVVKYKRYNNLEGPTYTINKADIETINYEGGSVDDFRDYISSQLKNKNAKPGMSYKEIKGMYNPKNYVKDIYDPYNPAVAGICSFFIPGLGQVLDGEVGRGLADFFGSAALAGLAYAIAVPGATMPNGETDMGAGQALCALACLAGVVAIDLGSIFGAVKIAKIKNMYNQDLRSLQTNKPDIKVYPSLACITPQNGTHIYPVMTLAVNF